MTTTMAFADLLTVAKESAPAVWPEAFYPAIVLSCSAGESKSNGSPMLTIKFSLQNGEQNRNVSFYMVYPDPDKHKPEYASMFIKKLHILGATGNELGMLSQQGKNTLEDLASLITSKNQKLIVKTKNELYDGNVRMSVDQLVAVK